MGERAYRVRGTVKFYESAPIVLDGRKETEDMLKTVEVRLQDCIVQGEVKVIEATLEDLGPPPEDHLERDYDDWTRDFEGKEPIETITFKQA